MSHFDRYKNGVRIVSMEAKILKNIIIIIKSLQNILPGKAVSVDICCCNAIMRD